MTFASDLGNSALFDNTFTLPSSDGTAGQFLQTDGSGTLSFADAGGGITYSKKTTTYTASSGEGVIADTSSGAWTLTLPATPSAGDVVIVADGADWSTNNLTVARNGSTIEGTAEDLVMDIGGLSVTLVFDGTTWQTYTQAGINSASGGGGGDFVLLDQQTVSSSVSSVDMALPSGYNGYRLLVNGWEPEATSQYLMAALSYDNGSTFVTNNNVGKVRGHRYYGTSDIAYSVYTGETYLYFGYFENGGRGRNVVRADLLISAESTSTMSDFHSDKNNYGGFYNCELANPTGITTAANYIRLLCYGRTVSSANVSLYGYGGTV